MRRVAALGLVAAFSALALTPSPASALSADPVLNQERAIQLFLADGKVADWVGHYPAESLLPSATFEPASHDWAVAVWSAVSPPAIEVAKGRVDDATGAVTEAWTGPQVAWLSARGIEGFIGGKTVTSPPIWLGFCALFLIGLCDLRRLASLRNLDLLVLLSFSVSLWFFNHGDLFTSAPLVYPPLLYLLARMAWIGWRGKPPSVSRPLWPARLMVVATILLVGLRIGLNLYDSNVGDVGLSGVIGAERIAHGQAPYGHMSIWDERGDTYGPVAYEAYLPGYLAIGWNRTGEDLGLTGYSTSGWKGTADNVDAARFTSILFDVLCLAGLTLVGRRLGGNRFGATLAFAWAAYPFTQYGLSSNTNDAIPAAFLIYGFWLASMPAARGIFSALAAWTKFAPLIVVPLWATYPDARQKARVPFLFGAVFAVTTLVAFGILLLEPDPLGAGQVFLERTVGFQLERDSPLSIWDWGQYHAGLLDLQVIQRALGVVVAISAFVAAFVPRRKSPLQLAALTAALLIGFEVVLTHWFYAYLAWFLPFVAVAVLMPGPALASRGTQSPDFFARVPGEQS
jgi:hypothetical protein